MKLIKSAGKSIIDVDTKSRTAVTKFATYNTLDRDKDRAFKGMFTKSWNEFQDVRVFLNHDKTQAPGKLSGTVKDSLWEDNNHAYAKMWFGTHTLGEDTLKQMSDGIITDSSYYMLPIKYDKNEAGGYNFREVFQKEVSVLTHWGAHPESKIISVQKSADELTIDAEVLKQLSDVEVDFLRRYISGLNQNMLSLASFSTSLPENSDLYSWANSVVSDLSYTISRFKERLVWGQKSWSHDELSERLSKLKSFCNNSTASDDAIQNVLKEAEGIEQLFMMADTPAPAQVKEQSKRSDSELSLSLLNIQMLLKS